MFIPTCFRVMFSFADVILTIAPHTFIYFTRNMFNFIFKREQGLDIPGVSDYSKVLLVICENTELFNKAA